MAATRLPALGTVQHSDTLYDIPRRKNATIYDLMATNSLTCQRIHIGHTLYLPTY